MLVSTCTYPAPHLSLVTGADFVEGSKGKLRGAVAEVAAANRVASSAAPAASPTKDTPALPRSPTKDGAAMGAADSWGTASTTPAGSNRTSAASDRNKGLPAPAEKKGGAAKFGSAESGAGVFLDTLAEMAMETREGGMSRVGHGLLTAADHLISEKAAARAGAARAGAGFRDRSAGEGRRGRGRRRAFFSRLSR